MNLRVRSVTGCSRSAMFASCIISLAPTLGIVDVHAATDRESVLLDPRWSSKVEQIHLGVACVHDKASLSWKLACLVLTQHILALLYAQHDLLCWT